MPSRCNAHEENPYRQCTVVDRVYKKKVGWVHYNQNYPRVRTKKLGWMSYSSTSLTLAIFCNQLFCQKILRKIGIFKNLKYFWKTCIWITQKNFNFEKIRWLFFGFIHLFFEKFWMIPYDKYTWEGQIFILRFITCLLQMKSTIKTQF